MYVKSGDRYVHIKRGSDMSLPGKKIRVLVVDDSAFMRRAISEMLKSDPGIEVIDTGRNGKDAVEKAKKLKPDVITLDIEMPEMDGLTALRKIMQECPTPVIMCSSLTIEGSHAAIKALSLGAIDLVAKDSAKISIKILDLENDLCEKVKIAAKSKLKLSKPSFTQSRKPGHSDSKDVAFKVDPEKVRLVVVGSSTGGPPVVEQLLMSLPADFCVPIVVAQHMPKLFTESLAKRLDNRCAISVFHGEKGMRLLPGAAYILPGENHGRIVRAIGNGMALDIGTQPETELYRPSANELMRTAAKVCGAQCLGIMLTGMGDDGVKGARVLVDAGGLMIAQSEESCVVYGMPKAVTEAGLASACLAPAQIAKALRSMVMKSGGRLSA